MKIKIDEDLPQVLAGQLKQAGYEATTVLEEELGGSKDPFLWSVIQREKKFLVTADKGFADIRTYPPGSHAGVLLLRPDADGIRPILDLANQVLSRLDLRQLKGELIVATPNGIRIRQGRPREDSG